MLHSLRAPVWLPFVKVASVRSTRLFAEANLFVLVYCVTLRDDPDPPPAAPKAVAEQDAEIVTYAFL